VLYYLIEECSDGVLRLLVDRKESDTRYVSQQGQPLHIAFTEVFHVISLFSLVLEGGDEGGYEHVENEKARSKDETDKDYHHVASVILRAHHILLVSRVLSCVSYFFPVFESLDLKEGQHGPKDVLEVIWWRLPFLASGQTVNFISEFLIRTARNLSTEHL
jgi:hypothetical protein